MTENDTTTGRLSADEKRILRRGWTTGACATAATKAAFEALITGVAPDPVEITLPKGETPAFALALEEIGDAVCRVGIIKDAGDDPDVTHGALVMVTVRHARPGEGVIFKAGEGVGTITKPGLPIPPGEPAINPVPRQMMRDVIAGLASQHGVAGDVEIEISVRDGAALALKTWNPRLGIVGGLSILGTTGIVHPFSCSAWIHSIHRGIDVASAMGLERVAGSTGSTSEAAVKAHYNLSVNALLDMGDFAGGMLKYLRKHPIPHVTIAGGFAKISKLANGFMDLHSGRSQVDFDRLADEFVALGGDEELCGRVRAANTAAEVLELAEAQKIPIADRIAEAAREAAQSALKDAPVKADVMIVSRSGTITAHAT